MKPTKTDKTINDIHEIRVEMSDRFGGDLFAIAQDSARRQNRLTDLPILQVDRDMNNEKLIRNLIKGSIQRAIQESAAAVVVLSAFAAILAHSKVGSPQYYGCLTILVATGFIAGVVWSYALSYQLLRSHTASDVEFWREAFQAQAKLLRLVPLWYCAPMCAGGILFVAPTSSADFIPFLIVASAFAAVIAGTTVLNRSVAKKIDEMATQLT